jgi:hypothetical protein
MTPARFRREALALPGAVEGSHCGKADFRAHGRIFASLHRDSGRAMVKVPLPRQQELLAAHPDAVEPASGAWGRAGCTMLRLPAMPVAVVRDALREAWQFAAGAGPARGRSSGRRQGR